jgi:hypothetical protein
MRLGLSHSVQIETCLDLVQTTLQTLSICPVDPGVAIQGREQMWAVGLGLLSPLGSGLRHRRRPCSGHGAAVQRFYISDGSLP